MKKRKRENQLTGASFILSSATAVGTILFLTRSVGRFSWEMRFWVRGGDILDWSTIFCLYANSFRASGGRTTAAAVAVGVISSKVWGEGRDIVVFDLGTELPGISVFGRLRVV